MDQLEQFRSGLLFRWIDVLVSLDDVDIDGELAGLFRKRLILRRNLRISLGAEIPDGGRILDEKREVVLVEQRQNAGRVRSYEIPHTGIETIVHVGEDEVEIGLGRANRLNLPD